MKFDFRNQKYKKKKFTKALLKYPYCTKIK